MDILLNHTMSKYQTPAPTGSLTYRYPKAVMVTLLWCDHSHHSQHSWWNNNALLLNYFKNYLQFKIIFIENDMCVLIDNLLEPKLQVMVYMYILSTLKFFPTPS